jgi:tetratricopeptide (TPR) repeat protein
VASGRATFVLGDDEIDAPAGTFVHAEPGTKRGAVATEPKTTVWAIGAKPGVPHEVSKWEDIFVAFGHLRNGDEARGREHLERVLAENPDEWRGFYNAACFEALTGNRNAAIRHLRRAAELEPQALEYAASDSDFDDVRDDPEFPK